MKVSLIQIIEYVGIVLREHYSNDEKMIMCKAKDRVFVIDCVYVPEAELTGLDQLTSLRISQTK